MPHNIGIVGAGGVAGIHAAILSKDSRVKLHRFFDVEPDRSQALAVRFGGHASGSIQELLEQCRLEPGTIGQGDRVGEDGERSHQQVVVHQLQAG